MKNDLKQERTIRESCITISKLFESSNFLERLCNISNNNIDEVINNLYLIINYYLSTNDILYTYNIQELLMKAKSIHEITDIIIHPTNNYYKKHHMIFGLNSSTNPDSNTTNLELLDQQVSFSSQSYLLYNTQITDNIREAIYLAHESPNIVFKSILKQPNNKELPIVVGTPETHYYQSILEIRLKNVDELYRKTKSRKAKKMIKNYTDNDALLTIFPRHTKKYSVSNKDLRKKEILSYVPSKYLSFIRIPSRYKLLSICAQNKQIRNGELIDIKTGEEYITSPDQPQTTYHLYYSRYELIDITDEFIYCNNEFTNDINYDIDLIYGTLDTNHSRLQVSKEPHKNIESIKSKDDIYVRKEQNKYYIRNGRHRIIYLKHFYVTNYQIYKEQNRLDKLKKLVRIPANVEHTIESINNILNSIKELNNKVIFFKTNINNENPEIMTIYENKVYITKKESELTELYILLSNNKLNNKYYIGANTNKNNINYEKLFDYLILTLKEKLYNMSLTDIIEYINTEGFYQKDQYFKISDFNYYYLYYEYLDFQHTLQIKRIFNKSFNIIEDTKEKELKELVGQKIMTLLSNNPDLILLEYQEFFSFISSLEEFKEYDLNFLELAANYAGYQKEKLLQFYQKEPYAKKLLL